MLLEERGSLSTTDAYWVMETRTKARARRARRARVRRSTTEVSEHRIRLLLLRLLWLAERTGVGGAKRWKGNNDGMLKGRAK